MTNANKTSALKLEIGAAVICVILGGTIFLLASQISPDTDEAIGPRTVPLAIGILISVLGALLLITAIVNERRMKKEKDSEKYSPKPPIIRIQNMEIINILNIIGCGVIYVLLFWATGYYLATLISLGISLFLFGTRKVLPLALISILGALSYQIVFMSMMGLDDPAGALINISNLTQYLSRY